MWGPALSPWLVCPVRGVWCQAPSLTRLPVLGGGQSGFRGPCVPGAVGAGMGAQHQPHSGRLAGRRCALWGWRKGVPGGGGTVRPHEGRLRSGAPAPVHPLSGRAVRVRRCAVSAVVWVWVPSTVPLACTPCGACVRRGWWGVAVSLVACHRCEGRLRPDALPHPAALLLGAAGARCPRAVGTSVRVWGPALSLWLVCPVRGVWCQVPSVLRLPVLWGGQPRFRNPYAPGAVGAGVRTRHRPHSSRPCELGWCTVGLAERRPRASAARRSPSPNCPPSGRAVGVRQPRAVGACVGVWGPGTVPLACMPSGGCVLRGW